ALRQFSGNSYVGGNFVQAASKDIGLTGLPIQLGFNPADVDEAKPEWIPAGTCTPVDASLPPTRLGHGTHAAGLLRANGTSPQAVRGTCKNCGIAMYRAALLVCRSDLSPAQVVPNLNANATDRGKSEAIDTGAQAVSMSFGAPNPSASYNCIGNRTKA